MPKKDLREQHVHIVLNKQEKEMLDKAVIKTGTNNSTYLRLLLRQAQIKEKELFGL